MVYPSSESSTYHPTLSPLGMSSTECEKSKNPRNVSVADSDITIPESVASTLRVVSEELDRLTVGPVNAIMAASATVFAIGIFEGYTQLRPVSEMATQQLSGIGDMRPRTSFVLRYAAAQVIPSVIWGSQSPWLVAQQMKWEGSATHLYPNEGIMPAVKSMRINRLTALRGAVAGSVLLAQVLSLTNIVQDCSNRYSTRIYAGKESPLDTTFEKINTSHADDPNWKPGVVIRLAGRESDVTRYSMDRMGRRRLWPIFEDASNYAVQAMVNEHGSRREDTVLARVPVFWQVNNAQYSRPESWRGLVIPRTWLFEAPPTSKRMLIMEADATSGDGSTIFSTQGGNQDDLDLDLREVGQGFHQIATLAPSTKKGRLSIGEEIDDSGVLRVLLLDGLAQVSGGGGHAMTARDFVTELGLADVVIDSRKTVIASLTQWLTTTTNDTSRGNYAPRLPWTHQRRPVLLETHSRPWFDCLKEELSRHGFEVLDRHDLSASDEKNRMNMPMIVAGRTSADTVYRVRALVKAGIVQPQNVCAILQDHGGLEELELLGMPSVSYVYPSEIYHNAFEQVRTMALQGTTFEDIQASLDSCEQDP